MKYYKEDTDTTTYVSFKLLDKSGKVIQDYADNGCFSEITYRTIPKDVATVLVRHSKTALPYDISAIKRWISDINEMGFPCSLIDDSVPTDFEKQKQFLGVTVCTDMVELGQKLLRHGEGETVKQSGKNDYQFEVRLADFEYKSHFITTLMLIRCLTETHICRVPEIYFQMMDDNPDANKFQTMQTAHKKLGEYGSKGSYHNTNHMITHAGNGGNVSKEELWKRYKACGFKVMGGNGYHSGLNQSQKWNGASNV